jgi:hypothetical protein
MTRDELIATLKCPVMPRFSIETVGAGAGLSSLDRGSWCPKLINMKGRRGIAPPGAVYIGRQMRFLRLPRSKWANPSEIGLDGTRAEVITK